MPYLGRAPGVGNTVTGDLAVSGAILADGQISGGRINHKLALDGSDVGGSNEYDQFIFEDGGTDGSGTNAGDNLLLENATGGQAISGDIIGAGIPISSISVGSSSSGQLLQSQGAGLEPIFATVAGGVLEKLFIASNSSSSDQTISTNTYTVATFDTEFLDQGSHFASNKFTAPSDGQYMFYATFPYMDSPGSVRQDLQIVHYNSSDSLQLQAGVDKTNFHEASMSGQRAFTLSAGDYVNMQVRHEKGSNVILHRAQFFGWRIV